MAFSVGKDFSLGNSLFGAVKLIKTPDSHKHEYSGYSTGFDARERFFSRFGKNVVSS